MVRRESGDKEMQYQQKKRQFSGPYAILLTPFLKNGHVDEDAYCEQVERLCLSEVEGLVVCGSTGEFTLLSADENIALMRLTGAVVNGRKKLIGGATASDTQTVLRYLQALSDLRYQGALTAPPFYFPLGDADVLDFYGMIAGQRTSVPIIAYQIPKFTADISMPVFKRLLEIEGIAGLKNSTGSMSRMMSEILMRDQVRPDFSLLSGSDECILPHLSEGADGNFTALTGIFPERVTALYQYRSIDAAKAQEIQLSLAQLVSIAESVSFPTGYKLLAEAAGRFRFGHSRQPISDERLEAVRKQIYEKFVQWQRQGDNQ